MVYSEGMITVDEHRDRILSAVRPLGTERLALSAARGRVLREPVHAAVDLPLFDNSAMDGFAVIAADAAAASAAHPVTLRIVGDVPAGSPLDPPMRAGEAVRIMTGAPVPTGADAIIPFEDTVGGLAGSVERVEVRTPARRGAGSHIRRRAEEHAAGDEVLAAGTLLGARQLAAAAASGVREAVVSQRPRIAVISTGDELHHGPPPFARGLIPESNSTLLHALCGESGAEVVLCTSVSDDGDGLRAAFAEAVARGADAVITSGGVSAGAYEVVRDVLPMRFDEVALQPGRPQGFGDGDPLLFGLPGNPVGVAVSFEVFVRPALRAMQQATGPDRVVVRLPARDGWRAPRGRRQYLPVVLDDGGVRPASAGGSHFAASLGRAEAYAVVPVDVDRVEAGDLVEVVLVP